MTSLLREHIPNDDRLFPRRLDTQIGDTPDTEAEWAVNHILSHTGLKNDSVFKIKWKSGDVTWMPYYQITYLRALNEYLDLLGVKDIHKLPKGAGNPPCDDPQIFLGAVALDLPQDPNLTNSMLHPYKTSADFVNHPDSLLAYSHSFPPTVSSTTFLSQPWPHLVTQDHEGSTTLISLASHQQSIVSKIPPTQSALPSMWPRSPSSLNSTRRFDDITTPPVSTPILLDTSNSPASGTMGSPIAIPGTSVSYICKTTSRITTQNPPLVQYTSPTSTLQPLKLDSTPMKTNDHPPHLRTLPLSTSMPPSWLPNRKGKGSLLRNVVCNESELSTAENYHLLEHLIILPSSTTQTNVPRSLD